ncbi:MAG: glycosyltransferase, partial [Euryarchaeota archaeon]|nr:glycosyltransferase [Euryarchaeota archaeon]
MEYIPLVSIIVGVRNMENTIGQCIESLLNCDYPAKEIIIVDDGSTDRTAEIVSRYPIRLINSNPKGISHARNLGLQLANGDIVAYTDGDCIVSENWLKELVKHFSDPKVASVGGRTIFKTTNDIASVCRAVEFEERYSKVPKNTVSAMGPTCAHRKDVLKAIGGFNPAWFHGEDAEVSYKIAGRGYKVIFENNAVTFHVPEIGVKNYLKKRLRDASAFVRVSSHHPSLSFRDKFITLKMVFQPFLFAMSIIFWPILLALSAIGSVSFFYPGLFFLLMASLFFWN